VIDGGGVSPTTGLQGFLQVPSAATITSVTLLADQTGSVQVDLWVCTYAAFAPPTHPASGDTITASDKPTITSGVDYNDTTLSGWTTALAAGSVIGYDVVSVTTITRVTVILNVTWS
jgi:hypothetical protein